MLENNLKLSIRIKCSLQLAISSSYWLIMTARTKMMRIICKKTTSSAFRGLDFKRNMMILNGLFGLLRLKSAPVSGLDL